MAQALRDDSWEKDVRRHIVNAMTQREKHTLATNLFAWLFCALVSLALPYSQALIIPLALRLASLAVTRFTNHRLRLRLAAHESYDTALCHVGYSLTFAGLSWGFLLWPVMHAPPVYPPAIAIVSITIVVVSLMTATMGTLPRMLFSFLVPFMATVAIGMFLTPHFALHNISIWAFVSLVGIIAGMAAYSLGTAREQLALAETMVENQRLSEELTSALCHAEFLSQRDPLTGLFNRRAFFEQTVLCEGAVLQHLLAIDLDHFKQINDRFGHDTGDRVLIATADAMREITYDLPGGPHCAVRLGGEEFAMVLSGLDRTTAIAAAEALRHRIARIVTLLEVPDLLTSASIGITEYRPEETLEETLNRADMAMYRAKRNGRNQVMQAAA